MALNGLLLSYSNYNKRKNNEFTTTTINKQNKTSSTKYLSYVGYQILELLSETIRSDHWIKSLSDPKATPLAEMILRYYVGLCN